MQRFFVVLCRFGNLNSHKINGIIDNNIVLADINGMLILEHFRFILMVGNALSLCFARILSENRFKLFGICWQSDDTGVLFMALFQSLKGIMKQRGQAFQKFWQEISQDEKTIERKRQNRLAPDQSEKFGCWRHRGIW